MIYGPGGTELPVMQRARQASYATLDVISTRGGQRSAEGVAVSCQNVIVISLNNTLFFRHPPFMSLVISLLSPSEGLPVSKSSHEFIILHNLSLSQPVTSRIGGPPQS